ncbi:MAG: 3-dehydroquinate synthase [Bacteroidetes bacterium]|nr:3-dehydroquinate synthase [Bacteroidota bacterium]
MEHLKQSFTVPFEYKVYFTSAIFDASNTLLADCLDGFNNGNSLKKIFFVVDKGVAEAHPLLFQQIKNYFTVHNRINLIEEILVLPGGETAKNNGQYFNQLLEKVHQHGIDRHSYMVAIGGGAILDLVGYAAAVSHRGIKHIRIPTTVLSQNDSGVGVKNGINFFGKKNFLGTFAPPLAVFNDELFLSTLSDRDWRSGIAEAVKVALIKDAIFFEWLEQHANKLVSRDLPSMKYLVHRCAALHLAHISGGDPFETGSSRPLDFGHWSAHKLEQLSDFSILHGEAVAMGIAMDTVYSHLTHRLSAQESDRIIQLLQNLGFALTHPLMEVDNAQSPILLGLQEFREHLGGQLTIMLLDQIGKGVEVHEMDMTILQKASGLLQQYKQTIDS